RSSRNNPSVLARAIDPASFVDASCSGAVTADMTHPQRPSLLGPEADLLAGVFGENPPQFDRLRPDTTLVTVGIGGNDAGLVGVGYQCAALGALQAGGSPCRDVLTAGGVDRIGQRIDEAAPRVAAVLRGIRQRSPHARVLLVGYPQVVPDDGRSCWPLPLPLSPGDVPFMADLLVRINAMLAREAGANGAEYVDTWDITRGYDVCQPPGRAGFTALLPLSGSSMPLHPNETGQHRVAEALVHVVRRGAPTGPLPPPSGTPASPPVRPSLSRITLTPRRLSVRVSAAAAVTATIDRRVTSRARRSGRARQARWRRHIRVTVRADARGTVRRRLARLPAGRYRVRVAATGITGLRSRTHTAIRALPRPVRR
ncbi:MAG: SGNH/GDSL hydrolase family protein, partial [Solirubrobacteraceae bacterium]